MIATFLRQSWRPIPVNNVTHSTARVMMDLIKDPEDGAPGLLGVRIESLFR
jgi:hypothetical protein